MPTAVLEPPPATEAEPPPAAVGTNPAPRHAAPPIRLTNGETAFLTPGVGSYADFAEWVAADDFPADGPFRFAWIDGALEVDMVGADMVLHETPKSQIGSVVVARCNRLDIGRGLIDGTIFLLPNAPAGNAPDVAVLTTESLTSGRVVRLPSVSGRVRACQGPPDLAVEIVSPTDPAKDAVRLFKAYFEGGVGEYWLVDATGGAASLNIFVRGDDKFVPVDVDADGYQRSPLLRAAYRLERFDAADGDPDFRLLERPDGD